MGSLKGMSEVAVSEQSLVFGIFCVFAFCFFNVVQC